MKIKIKLLFLLFMLSVNLMAQKDSIGETPQDDLPKRNFWDKFYVGGNIGLQFGTVTFMEFSPLVGYRFTEKISAGVGVTYQYYHYKDKFYEIKTDVYGARVFGRYMFTDYLFGHVEYEYLNLEAFDFFPRRRVDVGSLLAGGGYVQRFGNRSAIVAMVLYNFTESAYTPYRNPIIRIGFNFGI